MISSSRLYDDDSVHPAYLIAWYMYLFLVSMLGVRKSNLTGKKTKERNEKNYDNRKQIEDFIHKNRSNARAYYIRQCNRVKSKARIAYKISKKYKLAYSRKFHALNPSYVLQKCKNWYNINKETKTRKSIDYLKKHYYYFESCVEKVTVLELF